MVGGHNCGRRGGIREKKKKKKNAKLQICVTCTYGVTNSIFFLLVKPGGRLEPINTGLDHQYAYPNMYGVLCSTTADETPPEYPPPRSGHPAINLVSCPIRLS